MLREYHKDGDYIIHWDSELFDKELFYEEELVIILDKDVTKLRTKVIPYVKAQWRNRLIENPTWEIEADIRKRSPYLFID